MRKHTRIKRYYKSLICMRPPNFQCFHILFSIRFTSPPFPQSFFVVVLLCFFCIFDSANQPSSQVANDFRHIFNISCMGKFVCLCVRLMAERLHAFRHCMYSRMRVENIRICQIHIYVCFNCFQIVIMVMCLFSSSKNV